MIDQEKLYNINLQIALNRILEYEKEHILLKGHFTVHAKRKNIKVKDLIIAYENYKKQI